jgi:hypothetical protein
MSPGRTLLVLVAIALVALAFVRHRNRRSDERQVEARVEAAVARASVVSPDTTRPLAAGDIRIQNVDSSVQISLIGNNVYAGFSPKTLAKIRRETDTGAVNGTGFGASIEKMVKSTVQSALAKQVQYPVADIQDVRYEDGKLAFYWKNGKRLRLLENSDVNGKKVLESFPKTDADRFVAAFHARKVRSQ